MEQNPKDVLDRVKKKILALHRRNQDLLAENSKLREKRSRDTQFIDNLESKIKQLQNDLETLKLAKSFTDDEGLDRGAKTKINEMVKEIDRCIALLND